MDLLLGIDTSTTATKAVLDDTAGRVVAVGSTAHDHASPRPLWSEQDPADWWRATPASIREVAGRPA